MPMTVLITLALLLLQSPAAAANAGTVVGRLVATDGIPKAGVRIAAVESPKPGEDASANTSTIVSMGVTDRDGRYRLENVVPGTYVIVADPFGSPSFYPGGPSRAK